VKNLSIPDETHEAFDAHTDSRCRVGFCNRNIDQYRAVQNLFHHLHTFQDFSLGNLDLAKEFSFLEGKNMDTRDVFTRFPNPCSLKTKFCPMEV
jgi:hypothetical protein